MQEDIDENIEMGELSMEETLEHLGRELTKVRTGKASPNMFNGLRADYYGVSTPINQMASVSTTDARTIVIKPWDKGALNPIEQAIMHSNMGLNPQNDGEIIRINIPPLTQERRRDMVKRINSLTEDARISIRGARRDMMDAIKKAVKDGYPEDAGKREETKVEDLVKSFVKRAEAAAEKRKEEVMKV